MGPILFRVVLDTCVICYKILEDAVWDICFDAHRLGWNVDANKVSFLGQ